MMANARITVHKTDFATIEKLSAERGITAPIEQTSAWSTYQGFIADRTPWGSALIQRTGRSGENSENEIIGFIDFIDFQTHGYHFLRSAHGPVLFEKPEADEEKAIIDAIRRYIRSVDKKQVFARFTIWNESSLTHPVLSSVPYDQTVVIDTTGGDEAILARMRKRGRRDVRKALRESPAICSDETDKAMESFEEYYAIMVETAKRDHFTPASIETYSQMIEKLGKEHIKVFAARIDGKVAAWSIITVNGDHAVRYYAAMLSEVMRLHVTDLLVYFECVALGKMGITSYDLMGIGDDFSPTLKGLNEFKTKFAEEITPVAPDRDVPLRTAFYAALTLAKKVKSLLRR
jgi:hypothetical protein